MELSKQRSEELALNIELLKLHIYTIDADYMSLVSKKLYEHAGNIDSTAALNKHYDPATTQLMRKQASAMSLLVNFIQSLKDIQKDKDNIKDRDVSMDALVEEISGKW